MTDISSAGRAEVAAAHRMFMFTAVVVPVLVTLAGTALLVAWLPQLPNPVASHWGGSGAPDGFTSPMFAVWMTLGMGLGLTALLSGSTWMETKKHPGTWGWTQRFLGAMSPAVIVFLVVMLVGATGSQRGLSDAQDAPNIVPFMLVALLVGVAVGVLAWFVQPKVEFARPSQPIEMLELAPDERVVWITEARMGTGALVTLGVLALALVAGGVATLATDQESWWILLLAAVVVTFGAASSTIYRVRVDGRGLLVRSILGWPKFCYAPSRITAVAVTDISPMAEYGGWGLRMRPGGTGVVLRGGEAIVVTLTNGRTFAVTVDDAETGAALLRAVVAAQTSAVSSEEEK